MQTAKENIKDIIQAKRMILCFAFMIFGIPCADEEYKTFFKAFLSLTDLVSLSTVLSLAFGVIFLIKFTFLKY